MSDSYFAIRGYHEDSVASRRNADEEILGGDGKPSFIGSFHKTLPHNEYGEVAPADFIQLLDALSAPPADAARLVDAVPSGVADSAGFASPLAGRANERLLPQATSVEMGPAPGVLHASTAAELVELYWMALLRDLPFASFGQNALVAEAIQDLQTAFGAALDSDVNQDLGKLQLLEDLPEKAGQLDLTLQTLFRCGLPGEDKGPIVSQFFLHGVRYGTQYIDQRVQPFKAGEDYLQTYAEWLLVQRKAKDSDGKKYSQSWPNLEPTVRPFLTMRDLVTFVNKDALHQAYFNAALSLLSSGYPWNPGQPYEAPNNSPRQDGFASYGGPHLLTLVSEVASRALKIVWHQKWQVHRRQRPEAYAGRLHMELVGPPGMPRRNYGLSTVVKDSEALRRIQAMQGGAAFLPMPVRSGSPTHPAYGAGHATVAGACVTVLKAWFDGRAPIKDPVSLVDLPTYAAIPVDGSDPFRAHYRPLPPLADGHGMTVEGELNKLACNVAMGRSMAGVHYRSDNTRSLRLGETLAIVFLVREMRDFMDRKIGGIRAPFLEFNTFDRQSIRLTADGVFVNGSATLDPYFQRFLDKPC